MVLVKFLFKKALYKSKWLVYVLLVLHCQHFTIISPVPNILLFSFCDEFGLYMSERITLDFIYLNGVSLLSL